LSFQCHRVNGRTTVCTPCSEFQHEIDSVDGEEPGACAGKTGAGGGGKGKGKGKGKGRGKGKGKEGGGKEREVEEDEGEGGEDEERGDL
jgi:hypothetical protein